MKARVGTTLYSTTDQTTVIVVRWGDRDVDLTCGGGPMAETKAGPSGLHPDRQDGTQLGKRYADAALGIELLCTKAGTGTLAADGIPLPVKSATPLPSSD